MSYRSKERIYPEPDLTPFLGRIDHELLQAEVDIDDGEITVIYEAPAETPFVWTGEQTSSAYSSQVMEKAARLAGFGKFIEQEGALEYILDNYFLGDSLTSTSLANENKSLIPGQTYFLRKQ